MLASLRFRSDASAAGHRGHSPRRARLAPVALLLLGLAGGTFGVPVGAAAETVEKGSLGDQIHQRFRVWAEDDSIRLRPIEGDAAIRSIELEDDEEEVSVNGKAFSDEELRAFLGKDGELIAELAALDAEERRAALGLDDDEAQREAEDEGASAGVSGIPGVPPVPPTPPVSGRGPIRIESDGDDRVSFGRSIHVEAGETTGDTVCIGCSVTVSGHVEGDAVAVGGSVTVESGGLVEGSAVAVGGKVRLESGAAVEQDAVAIGGSVQAEEGATVEGQRSTVGWGGDWGGKGDHGWSAGWPFVFDSDAGELLWSILRTLFLLLLCCISALLARGSMERSSRRLTEEPWKAVFAGLLTQLLFFPVLIFVTVILAVSIVGIPLLVLVPVAVLALLVATLLGFAAVAQSLGRWAGQRFGWQLAEPFLPVVVGVAMIQGVTILARFLGLPGGFLGLFAFALIALGFFLKYVAWTMGLGAMTLSLLGRDWRRPDAGSRLPAQGAGFAEPAAAAEPMPVPPAPPAPAPAASAEGSAERGGETPAGAADLELAEDLAAGKDEPKDDVRGA